MNPFRSASAVFLAALLAIATLLGAETFSSRGVAEEDGDTFWVVRQGKREKIRIHGIDAPEMDQPYGKAAKKFAAKLAFGKVVTVQWEGRGKYGRIIGRVRLPAGTSPLRWCGPEWRGGTKNTRQDERIFLKRRRKPERRSGACGRIRIPFRRGSGAREGRITAHATLLRVTPYPKKLRPTFRICILRKKLFQMPSYL